MKGLHSYTNLAWIKNVPEPYHSEKTNGSGYTHAHTHIYIDIHPYAHDKSVIGLSKSEEVFCLKGGLRQRGSSPSLFNACWVVAVGVFRGMEMCGWWCGAGMDDRPGSQK